MGAHLEFHQRIARHAALHAGAALPLKPHDLAVIDPGWDVHIDGAALGQRYPPLGPDYGIQEINVQGEANVAPAHARIRTRASSATAITKARPEQIGENVPKIKSIGASTSAGMGARALTGPPSERHALVAVGVNLAAVEAALAGWVRKQIESGRGALEPLLGRAVAGAHIRVQLLGELAVRAANIVGGRASAYAECGIRVPAQGLG